MEAQGTRTKRIHAFSNLRCLDPAGQGQRRAEEVVQGGRLPVRVPPRVCQGPPAGAVLCLAYFCQSNARIHASCALLSLDRAADEILDSPS